MFIDSNNQINSFTTRNYIIWFSLAFQAGAINVGGFLACHRFVTHTTGFATHFGAEFSRGLYQNAFGMLSVPAFFLLGSVISAILIDKRKLQGKIPNYPFVFLFISILLIFSAVGGVGGGFGDFGSEHELKKSYILLISLSLTSGLQNAVITTASGAAVRTTHLTGLTTDLGIGIVRILSGLLGHEKQRREIRFNWLRIGTISSFVLGSTLSAYIFNSIQFYGFLIPAIISFILFLYVKHLRLDSNDK
jgi:uncharacterized membrane protein YoaK (UPF0700 family)